MVRPTQDVDKYICDDAQVSQGELGFIQLALFLRYLDRGADDLPDRLLISRAFGASASLAAIGQHEQGRLA